MGCRSCPAPVELDPDAVVIMITGHGTVESAVEAMRAGAFDYLLKPLPSNDILRLAVERAAERRRLIEENRRLREPLASRVGFDNLVGKSAEMVSRLRPRPEGGTVGGEHPDPGRVRHREGADRPRDPREESACRRGLRAPWTAPRCRTPSSSRSCSGTSAAPSPAPTAIKPGMIEVADRGTLFLDEIGELPEALQAKLLRALQERQIRRVGGTKFVDVDIRLVSATNRDAAELVRKGEFREDLFYRINVITISLPPLRERAGDVPLLAYHFLRRYGRNRERPLLSGIDPDALACLEAYAWPGNVRELQNAIERACALADGPMTGARDLPEHIRGRGRPAPIAARGGPDLPRRPGELAPGVRPGVPHRSVAAPRRERLAGRQGGGPGPEDPPRLLAKHGIRPDADGRGQNVRERRRSRR